MSDERFAHRSLLVTGAGSGIGAATAARLAREGATVAVTDIDGAAAETACERIVADGGLARAYAHDVASRESWEEVVAAVAADAGRLDGLVNNAGITRDRTLARMSDEEWSAVIAVNLTGVWLGCQTAMPHLIEAEAGAIVNLSSESRWGAFGQSNYASAKAGVAALSRTVALEHARHGVRSNAVAPGAVRTPMTEVVPSEQTAGWIEAIPLHRFAAPAEIAAVIAFLLSDDASYLTGQTIAVDGGSQHG